MAVIPRESNSCLNSSGVRPYKSEASSTFLKPQSRTLSSVPRRSFANCSRRLYNCKPIGPLKLGPIPASLERAVTAPETTIIQERIVKMLNEYFITTQYEMNREHNLQCCTARGATNSLPPI